MIFGFARNDVIKGLGGNDLLCGGDGNDVLTDGDGDDAAYGEAGADTLIQSAPTAPEAQHNGRDVIDGGSDADLGATSARHCGRGDSCGSRRRRRISRVRAVRRRCRARHGARRRERRRWRRSRPGRGNRSANRLFGGEGDDTLYDGGGVHGVGRRRQRHALPGSRS